VHGAGVDAVIPGDVVVVDPVEVETVAPLEALA
jgi:hypothetical protein